MSSDGDARAEAAGTEERDGSAPRFQRAELAEDARALVEVVESVHPDPYRGYGGRVELHRRLEETVRDLPEAATSEEFYRLAAPLVAGMDDAHSLLRTPGHDDDGESDRLPVSFRVVGEDLCVESVAEESLRDLLGARLVAVEGEPLGELVDRGARLRGAENRYTALSYASRGIEGYDRLGRLLDRAAPPAEPTLTFAVDGTRRDRTLAPVPADAESADGLAPSVDQPAEPGPRYRLYEDGDAALFVPGNLSVYRESLEAFADRDANLTDDLVRRAHGELFDAAPPDDTGAAIAELPSMVETLTDLVRAMEAADTRTLVVDLRDNPGGDSQFVNHLAYVLEGWDGVAAASESLQAVKRRTDRHREAFGRPDQPGTADDNPADYDFPTALWDADRDERIERSRDRLTAAETFAAEVEDGTHEAYYRPERVVVVTSASTMSSAFAAAAQLRALGADVVGVPSGQAPVSFGEAVEEELPNTGLTARVAGSMYWWATDVDGDVLPVDRELTPERFERYDRAADAALRLAFDHAGVTDGEVPDPA